MKKLILIFILVFLLMPFSVFAQSFYCPSAVICAPYKKPNGLINMICTPVGVTVGKWYVKNFEDQDLYAGQYRLTGVWAKTSNHPSDKQATCIYNSPKVDGAYTELALVNYAPTQLYASSSWEYPMAGWRHQGGNFLTCGLDTPYLKDKTKCSLIE